MVRIEIRSGPDAGTRVELAPGQHLVGRNPASAIAVHGDTTVSARHLELDVSPEGVVRFKDLGSTNGTWSGGARVAEGEWFAGTELRLGTFKLRLVAPDEPQAAAAAVASAVAAEEAAVHRRAVEEALSRRGGTWKAIAGAAVALAVLAALGYWLLLRPGAEGARPPRAVAGTEPGGAATEPEDGDLLAGRGRFRPEDHGSWSLGAGLALGDSLLRGSGPPSRAALAARLPCPAGGLRVEGEVSGLRCWPEIEWGEAERDGAEGATVIWRSAGEALGAGPVVLPAPDGAAWFRLALVVEGEGTLRDLRVVGAGAAPLRTLEHEQRSYRSAGANLSLLRRDGASLLSARGAAGSAWEPAAGGLDLRAAAADSWILVEPGAGGEESEPMLLLADGGPVAASGARADATPGFLVGGDGRRLLVRFEPPARASAEGGGVLFRGFEVMRLRWDLADAFGQAARASREMEAAARAGDGAALLRATGELLRDWPLDEAQVEKALALRRDALLRGRQTLAELQAGASEALFLRSVADMRRLERAAEELAAALPGTDAAREAREMASVLRAMAAAAERERREQEAEYRARLQRALERTYPLLAAWLRERAPAARDDGQEKGP